MIVPKPMQILRMVASAVKNRDKWERALDHRISATDEAGIVEVELEARAHRFVPSARLLKPQTDAATVASATLAACNRALQAMDSYWTTQHERLDG